MTRKHFDMPLKSSDACLFKVLAFKAVVGSTSLPSQDPFPLHDTAITPTLTPARNWLQAAQCGNVP
jgi:hypothetical protein